MSQRFTVACVQNTAQPEVVDSMVAVSAMVRRARDAGADFITTPEVVAMMEPRRQRVLEKAQPEETNEALAAFRELARETGAWLLVGSLTVKVEPEKVANRSFLLDPAGEIVAKYDKLHMFDVDLVGGESYRKSRTYRAGDRAVIAPLPWGVLGMTVCYDLRFPYLYRDLAKAGAQFLTIPSAFTRATGKAHWHVLMRARAIETGCYVFAPAQCGEHAGGRKSYGHSVIVDPWGEILADGGEEPGIIVAEVDLARVAECRGMIPSLGHDRDYTRPEPIEPERALKVANA